MGGKHYVKRCLPKKHYLQLQNAENNLAVQQKNGGINDGNKPKNSLTFENGLWRQLRLSLRLSSLTYSFCALEQMSFLSSCIN